MNHVFNFEDYYEEEFNTTATFIPDSNTYICNTSLPNTAARLLGITYVFIFNMAISGNLLVGLVVISVNHHALTQSDVYLFNLTIADFLLALTLPFWATESFLQSWIFGDVMCKIISLIADANFYTSILFLVCISIDRYLAIVHTARSHRARQRYCSWFACACIWVIGVALALPALFKDSFEVSLDKFVCAEPLEGSSKWKLSMRVVRHVLGFLLPLIVMVTCYGITISRLLRTRGFKKHRAMRLIVVVVAAFLLCWLPYHLALIIDTAMRLNLLTFDCVARRAVDTAALVTQSLALSHCCINPLLYAMVGERFWGNLAKLKFRRGVTSRASFSRSTSQTSEGNAMIS